MNRDYLTYPTVCFIGESYEKIGLTGEGLKELLRPIIIDSIKEGYKTFITDMSSGFGLPAADIVIEEMETNENLHLLYALPYENYTKGWTPEDKKHFIEVEKHAKLYYIPKKIYGKYRDLLCKKYIINNSIRLIIAFAGNDEYMAEIIEYTKNNDIEIINILGEKKNDAL